LKASTKQIFEYLHAVKNLTSPPVRDVIDYEYHIKIEELPVGEGCYLYGTGDDSEAWLEVHKQNFEGPPSPTEEVRRWIKTDFHNENIDPTVYDELEAPNPKSSSDEDVFIVEKFEEDLIRCNDFQTWLEKWHTWSEETKQKKKVQELYSYFFTLSQRFDRESESLDLAFGHGILRWMHPEGCIHHPVLITKMELSFNAKEGVSTIKPVERGTVLETEMISNLDIPNLPHISRFRKGIEEMNIDPRHEENAIPIIKEFVHMLHPEGKYSENLGEKNHTPVIYNNTLLFLRKRSGQYLKEDLLDAVEKIDQGYPVPQTIKNLVDLESDSINKEESEGIVDNSDWDNIGDELLFPLPANEDQKDIARRLSKHCGIVVQGPPGTGKSHTIANLISHLLAHGKRVLVTSQKERPLRVLSERLPEEIRSLCVSVLGGDSKSISEVEDSIRSLTDKMSSLEPDVLQKQIKQDQEQLFEVRKEIAVLTMKMKNSAQNQYTKFLWNNKLISPIDAAKKIFEEQQQFGWIPDKLTNTQNPPLTDEEMERLWQLLHSLSHKDKAIIGQFLPSPEEIDHPSSFEEFIKEGSTLENGAGSVRSFLTTYQIPSNKNLLDKAFKAITQIISYKSIFDTDYLHAILEDVYAGGEREKIWVEFNDYLKEQQSIIGELSRKLSEYEIILPDRMYILSLKQDAEVIKAHLEKGKNIGKMFLLTTGRKVKDFYENTSINKRVISSMEDINLIIDELTMQEIKEKLRLKWNRTFEEVNGPVVKESQTRILVQIEEIQKELDIIFQLRQKILQFEKLISDQISVPVHTKWTAYKTFENIKRAVDAAYKQLKLEEWKKTFEQKLQKLGSYVEMEQNHPICFLLYNAMKEKDKEKWYTLYQEVIMLNQLKRRHFDFEQLLSSLRNIAPLLAAELSMKMGSEIEFPKNWRMAWEWSQLNTWLNELNSIDVEVMELKIHELQKQERDLIKTIVANKTWKSQLERITPSQRSALQAWKQKLKKIGAGTSKYIERYRREAREEMKESRSAIPVWIMPVDRVIENFAISSDMFDVVIIDESSQCDVFSLSVLLRAKKAVVVGDDQQISPTAPGKNFEKVHGLMDHYLEGVPQAHTFDLQTSLYDIARRVFPGSLMLKEHFRCAPEIIQFSNDLSYGGEIIPLRIPKASERLEPAVLAKRVPGFRKDGSKVINVIEAEAIVEDIKSMLSDPTYNGRTMGVISLLGDHQAPYIFNLLRNEIGEEEIVNRKILCGDAYDFQGDERDIIFLSLVIANNVGYKALTGEATKRFNVAASRAQNQMRLYHSVDLDDLTASDLRARLLLYCMNPGRVNDEVANLEEKCESPFEIDVLRMIVARGYKVTPQVPAGSKRIDLVIEGMKDRLAVECDGDKYHPPEKWEEDMDRQRTLERVGWKFWRVRGSEFYRDRDKSMKSLWEKLHEMKIEPNLTNDIKINH
jgi:superfamily I DNA and/or RNA helicase/very-short-patch-repair endonuclease